METNLFYTVMEAEGDLLEPFTPTEEPTDEIADQQQGQTNEQPPADMGAEDLPPDPGGGMEDLGSFDETGGEGEEAGDMNGEDNPEGDQPKESLSKKADAILNQQLYQELLDRNENIATTLENLQAILPVLPYDIVSKCDKSINRLKQALTTGQEYALEKFVDSGYGENLLFFQKLSSLYTLLQSEIDSVLVKFQKEDSD